ncbi:hypothetical protein BH23ACT2_BH23ACT2_19490 [soil metagenome]
MIATERRPSEQPAAGGLGPVDEPGPVDGLRRWWNGLGRGPQVLVALVAAVVILNAALAGVRSVLGGDPGGPVSSSFGTGTDGLEGYADLLAADGRAVTRLREPVTADALGPGFTVVVADPDAVTPDEARALVGAARGGGRLVLAGQATTDLLGAVSRTPVRWERDDPVDRLAVWVPGDVTGVAEEVAGDRGGRWADVGPLVPLLGAGDRPALVAGPVGDGEVVALADAELLHNANLADGDNAAFALALAGSDAPVVFVESVHGFSASGLDAVPPAWKWSAAGLALALLAALWCAGARFGPPEPQRRELRPPRRDHVEAVAADLDRVTPDPLDLAGALEVAAVAARHQRAVHHLSDPPARETGDSAHGGTVAADHPRGDPP